MTITQDPPANETGTRLVLDPAPAAGEPPPPPSEPRTGRGGGWRRYERHLWIGGISLLVIAAISIPISVMPRSQPQPAPTSEPARSTQAIAAAPTDLSTSVTISATEFKFGPTSVQVPVGQKVTFTLRNTGVVEHDLTIAGTDFKISARPGETATGDFTFDKTGSSDFYCSIPGHKDAGMRGTLSVVDASAGTTAATQPQAPPANAMANMPGMASGSSLPSTPDILPLPDGLRPLPAPELAPPVTRTEPAYVRYDLTTQKVTALMADGVAYDYWTFNGTVPGPMLRVREGDTVEIDLHNPADAGVTHSIDLHAVSGPGGGASVMQVQPGQDGSFKFEALTPGVFVYHCATPMVAQHIASGMYGLIVVEPKAGLPTVDGEIYLMQGDFYLQGQRGDLGLRAFDLNKMLDERPDYVLFNGAVGATSGANAFHASVGQTIRIFFGVGGPNLTSSFHVIGAVLDRVYPEGSLTSPPETDVQTTHVSSGGATMVEFTPKEPGTYTIVDHSLGRMEKGAAGQIVVDGPADPQIFQSITAGSGGSGGH
jgi:nitrite reductase (NO-forming)